MSEHDAGTYTMVYHCKGTCICSLTNRCTRVGSYVYLYALQITEMQAGYKVLKLAPLCKCR